MTMKSQAASLLRRSIHIQSAPSVTIPSSVGIDAIQPNAESIRSSPKDDLEQPQFQALGNPPTIVNVTLAPSLPVYFQKGTLLSIYGASINNITSNITWLNPIRRVLLGFHSFRYQRLESTKTSTALISSSPKKNKYNSTVSTLTLNGSVDWALLPNDAVLAYSGSSLRITTEPLPRLVKQDGWFKIGNVKTGLYVPWKSGYTLVSGRGDVVVKGEGSVYRVELTEDEQVLIKRDNIVGISVNGDELSRCVSEHKGFAANTATVQTAEAVEVVKEINEEQNKQLEQFKQYWNQFKEWGAYFGKLIVFSLPKVHDNYVTVSGPRTILVQSDLKSLNLLDFEKSSSIEIIESKLQKAAVEQTSPQDFLSYVTVKEGKVTFHSTPDFKETVQKLETTKEN